MQCSIPLNELGTQVSVTRVTQIPTHFSDASQDTSISHTAQDSSV